MALGMKPVLHASESFLLTVKTQKEIARNNVWASPACKSLSCNTFNFYFGEEKCKKGKEHCQAF